MSNIIESLSGYDNNIQKENINQSDTAKALIKKDEYGKKRGRMSNEEILQKLLVYQHSYVDFIRDFGRIRTVSGLKRFNMFDYQEDLINKFQNNRFNIILKARQLGISTIVGAFIGTYCIFHAEEDILIASMNEDVAKELILKIKTFFTNLPQVVRPVILNPRNKESIELKNGTRIIALTSTKKTGRSFTGSFAILDETAFIDNAEELWTSLYPTLSLGGRGILLSTPNIENDFFHKMWVDAENKDNEFTPTKLYWYFRPEYNNEKWKRITIANLCRGDINKFEREYNCSFLSSSKTVIPASKINEILKRNHDNNIKKIENFVTKESKTYEDLNIYELPKENAIYLISCDTAEGLGQDRDASAFLIFNITENKIIGEYANKDIKEKNLANLLNDIGLTYNTALIVLEMRSTGQLVAQYLLDNKGLNYPNIFWSDRRSGLFLDDTAPMNIISKYSVKDKNALPGFYTTSKNKSILVPEMKNIVIDNETEILTNDLLEQLKSYVAVNGKYKAEGKNNDDLISAFFIGLYIKKMYWKLIENNNLLTDEIIKYFSRDVVKATDNKGMADILRFAPVWKTGKHQTLYDPYNSNKMLGDLRCFLDEKK